MVVSFVSLSPQSDSLSPLVSLLEEEKEPPLLDVEEGEEDLEKCCPRCRLFVSY